MIVEPFADDAPEKNHNVVGRVYYSASTMLCVPHSLAFGGPALGAQAGEARLRSVVEAGASSDSGGRRRRRSTWCSKRDRDRSWSGRWRPTEAQLSVRFDRRRRPAISAARISKASPAAGSGRFPTNSHPHPEEPAVGPATSPASRAVAASGVVVPPPESRGAASAPPSTSVAASWSPASGGGSLQGSQGGGLPGAVALGVWAAQQSKIAHAAIESQVGRMGVSALVADRVSTSARARGSSCSSGCRCTPNGRSAPSPGTSTGADGPTRCRASPDSRSVTPSKQARAVVQSARTRAFLPFASKSSSAALGTCPSAITALLRA